MLPTLVLREHLRIARTCPTRRGDSNLSKLLERSLDRGLQSEHAIGGFSKVTYQRALVLRLRYSLEQKTNYL